MDKIRVNFESSCISNEKFKLYPVDNEERMDRSYTLEKCFCWHNVGCTECWQGEGWRGAASRLVRG